MNPTASMRRWRNPSARWRSYGWRWSTNSPSAGAVSSYFNLPARKEGFLPGAANMRLPRFVGERLAREALLFDRTFHADTPEGRLIANEVVPSGEIDRALARCIEGALGSGMVSPGANRKAIRQQTEPLETFRRYLTTYAFEQAFCHLSDQLIVNLEKHWNAKQRKL